MRPHTLSSNTESKWFSGISSPVAFICNTRQQPLYLRVPLRQGQLVAASMQTHRARGCRQLAALRHGYLSALRCGCLD